MTPSELVTIIIDKAKLLAIGDEDPVVVSTWAIDLELNNLKLMEELSSLNPKIVDLLYNLQLAGQLGDGRLLYSAEDFEHWVQESGV